MLYQEPRDLKLWADFLARLALGVPEKQDVQLRKYLGLLSEWNTKLNLTSGKSTEIFIEVTCADAIWLGQLLEALAITTTVDVGSGGGAPILPLLQLNPRYHGVLVEPRRRRAEFLQLALKELGLGGRSRAVQGKINPKSGLLTQMGGTPLTEKGFDLAISRATFEPSQWLPLGLRQAHWVAVFTTSKDNLPTHPDARLISSTTYELPFTGSARAIGVYENIRRPKGYLSSNERG